MLTQCPACGAAFRIRAAQFVAAQGFVECGECAHVFNAVLRLADEPEVATGSPAAAMQADYALPEALEGRPTSAVSTPVDVPPTGAAGDQAAPRIVATPDIDVETLPRMRVKDDASADNETPPVAPGLTDVPEVLREDIARLSRRGRGPGALWTVMSLLLLGAFVAQLAWAHRESLFARYPASRPYAERVCRALHCRLRVLHDSSAIALVARDVREHPRYSHALLVNANLANRAQVPAAYPIVQLGIYDAAGALIGVRRFAPAEYLDDSIDVDAGMPPGKTVYVVLELAEKNSTAASFEFDFL